MRPIVLDSALFLSIWGFETPDAVGVLTYAASQRVWKRWKQLEAKIALVRQKGSKFEMLLSVGQVSRDDMNILVRVRVLWRKVGSDTHTDCLADYLEAQLRRSQAQILALKEQIEILEVRLATLAGGPLPQAAAAPVRTPPPRYESGSALFFRRLPHPAERERSPWDHLDTAASDLN